MEENRGGGIAKRFMRQGKKIKIKENCKKTFF
jgi:hypothetical protein